MREDRRLSATLHYTADLGMAGEIDILIEYDFFPAERQTRTEPGCEASADITGVTMADGSPLQPEIAAGLMESLRGDDEIKALCVANAIHAAKDAADNAAIDRAEYEQSRFGWWGAA